jgi:hypothetical protein
MTKKPTKRGNGWGGRRPNQTGRPRKAPKPPLKRRTASKTASKVKATIDPHGEPFDPRRVLAALANDPNAPATARVGAAKALLSAESRKPKADPFDGVPDDKLARRTLEILARRRIQ